MSEFWIRIIASVLGLLLLGTVLYFNGIIINIAVFFLICIGLFEIRNAFLKLDIDLKKAYLVLVPFFVSLDLYFNKTITLSIFFIMGVCLFDLLFFRNNLLNVAALCFSLFYLVLGFSSIILINDPILIGLIFIIAFSTDSFAYLIGITLGKHKLIPDVSPKKSLEGSVGGIVGTIIISSFYLSFFSIGRLPFNIILGLMGSIIAQCGDLVASRIKRDAGIKDFGNLIPGHGGVLDRFDSVILVAPLVMILYLYFY